MSRRLPLVLTLAGLLALSASASSLGAGKTRYILYAGALVGDPSTTVLFEVRKRRGENIRAAFHPENLELHCDDGTSYRATLNTYGFPFVTNNTFRGEVSLNDPHSGVMGIYAVKGRLMESGQAKGYIFEVADYPDPPRPGFPDSPDCSTGGKLGWQAQRTTPGDSEY